MSGVITDPDNPTPAPVTGPATAPVAPAPAPTPSTPTPAPAPVAPVKRGGLAGIVDEFRDAVAGTPAPQVKTDAQGNKYIEHPDSNGQKWLRVAGTALRGASAGYANGQGPGGKSRALAAGLDVSDKLQANRQQNEKSASDAVRQSQADKFNSIKLKHDQAAMEFQLQRLKIKANQDDVLFAQSQIDREHTLGSADLGVYKDEADLANVKAQHPDFWKSVYQNNIVAVPELGEDGTRQGVHVFLRTPGIGSQLVDPGTPIKVFTPGKMPNDPPTLVDQIPSGPMTHDMVDAYNAAAYTKYQKVMADKGELDLKAATAEADRARASQAPSEIRKNDAAANKDNAEATAAREESAAMPAIVDGIGDGSIAPDRIGYILGRKDGQKLLAAVKQKFPTLDTSKLESYPKLYNDFVSGKSAQSLQNVNTAFQHVDDLLKLNTYGSRIPGSEAAHSFENKLTNTAAEIANALAKPGATATKDEIHQVKTSLSPWLNRDSAIKTQIHSMIEQYRSVRNKWLNGAPSDLYEAKMPDLSPEAKAVVRKYAPEDANVWWGKPVLVDGQVVGYTKDGKTMESVGSVR